ncbi:MAG TPA: aminotransferase class I/II-fold pyridoxal phosphate-dependent enzyme [Chitinophagales bacterium]|nr:aminotransferase class I/II-fold pyridoxal phosphate-dependent enzyme [Chitinophagales bacterium]
MAIATTERKHLRVSNMAEHLIGSEIIKLAWEVNDLIKSGAQIFNFTIGDFDPQVFPVPAELENEIVKALQGKLTNYPPANGIPELRKAVSNFLSEYGGIDYSAEEILITSGGRPAIYSTYMTLLDPGDGVIFPVPSWNNNHYCHLSSARPIPIETKVENNFMPTADEMRPYIKDATLLALCSPQNPTGTTFTKEALEEICDMVLEENERRSESARPDEVGEKPLYVLYDQMYWVLTYGNTVHYNPVSLRPEMRDYTIFIDGISKSCASTGLRVGWAFGPESVIDKMKSIASHIGAWAPKPEQVATAKFLMMKDAFTGYLTDFKEQLNLRLEGIYEGLKELKSEGHDVDAIAPQAALYLTVHFDLKGKKTPEGKTLSSTQDVTAYLLHNCGMAIVPFYAFGSSNDSTWYRLSVGTCKLHEIEESIAKLRSGLEKLK